MPNEGFLDTTGKAYLGIGICDRCKRKFSLTDLYSDRNFPQLKVCRDDIDDYDPWREPAPEGEVISLRHPRPDEALG